MYEKIAAKNLLEENSCYQCGFLDDEFKRCRLTLKNLPKELHCKNFSSSELHSQWSEASLKDINTYIDLYNDVEKILKSGRWT